jgi:DNA-binding IclR family transcriptional regulator
LGLLSLPDGAELGLETAARLLNRPRRTTETLLERLVDVRMLETPRSRRYRFHELLRLERKERT